MNRGIGEEDLRPAVFTSRNDNTVGTIISGSTGNPSSADVAVAFYTVMEWPTLNLNDLRVLYAGTGFQFHGAANRPVYPVETA